MSVTKIVITGGPCGGKTTGMSWIQKEFSKKGYTVLFVPETATELISGGISPATCASNAEFQKCQMKLQTEKERVFEFAAKEMNSDKVLIVCDRGAIDNKAYMNPEEYAAALDFIHANEVELRDSYDAVFHLATAAKGAVQFYTTANNTARSETPEQAIEIDDRLISAWTGHPHLRIIDNSGDFKAKMQQLIGEISAFLGEPYPVEIERKFLIEYPDVSALEALPNCVRVEIIQSYIKSTPAEEIRIRQRGIGGNYMYYETRKRTLDSLRRVEIERRLTKDEYLALLMQADPDMRAIRKDRYCLAEGSSYFEIDVYPFWNDRAVLEIELSDPEQEFSIPDYLNVIREITDDPEYRTAVLARI